MKKVINGKVYNTETAKEICKYSNGKAWNDFDVFASELYQTKKGSFFVLEYDFQHVYVPLIKVLSESEAKEYVEKYGNADDYIKTFENVEEA